MTKKKEIKKLKADLTYFQQQNCELLTYNAHLEDTLWNALGSLFDGLGLGLVRLEPKDDV